jgi:hypothetical protein
MRMNIFRIAALILCLVALLLLVGAGIDTVARAQTLESCAGLFQPAANSEAGSSDWRSYTAVSALVGARYLTPANDEIRHTGQTYTAASLAIRRWAAALSPCLRALT